MKNTEINGQYSRIEKSTKFKGDIISEADFRIDGVLNGTIKTKGKVIIKDLVLLLSVGIHKFEKLKKQKVKFNIEITTDPNLKPDVKTIVNYESIVNDIKKLTEKTHFDLLENLSESIFDDIFKNKKIKRIKLRIEKLDIMKETSSVGIEVVKTKI